MPNKFYQTALLLALILSACAPSETVVQTAIARTQVSFAQTQASFTSTPTPTPIPTSTLSPTQSYMITYNKYLQEWADAYLFVKELDDQIADGTPPSYLEGKSIMEDLLSAATKLAAFTPPSSDLQYFQDSAESIQRRSKDLLNFYILFGKVQTTTLEHAFDFYSEIAEKIDEGN